MTHLEQAITDALSQGYEPSIEEIPEAANFSALQILVAMKSDVFLDSGFWQALGRARGWTTQRERQGQDHGGDERPGALLHSAPIDGSVVWKQASFFSLTAEKSCG